MLDAHDPYPRVPDGTGWLPAQDPVDFPVFDVGQDSEYHRYVRGELNDAGTHEELLERCAIYRHLWMQQNRHQTSPGTGASHDRPNLASAPNS